MRLRKNAIAALIGAALIGSATVVAAQQPGGMMGGQGAGPGMMGAPGGAPGATRDAPSRAPAAPQGPTQGGAYPGYPGGYGGYGYGMGPGMMGGYGGYGMGPGMMGGYGMGPGMMGGYGGYGMGPGMMGGYGGYGYGMGPGSLAYGPLASLDLSADQRARINTIQRDLRKRLSDLRVKMTEQSVTLDQLYDEDKPDRKAMLSAYKAVQNLQQQGIEARLEAQDKIEAVLTKEQQDQLRAWNGGWSRP
ncbi:MAG TPA: Spy/CpxP family protein refolding chaperone [Burkholderiales bacterium]|nr:Spy/CpxP family protein refolding chaperone [Burkholderiales bacterium]